MFDCEVPETVVSEVNCKQLDECLKPVKNSGSHQVTFDFLENLKILRKFSAVESFFVYLQSV